jgi:uncharacterized protein YaaR (DUF327 family)
MILIYEGFPTNQKAKVADVSKFGRAVSEFAQSVVIYAFVVEMTEDIIALQSSIYFKISNKKLTDSSCFRPR